MAARERLAALSAHLAPGGVRAGPAAAVSAVSAAAPDPSSVPVRWDERVERFAPGSREAADKQTKKKARKNESSTEKRNTAVI